MLIFLSINLYNHTPKLYDDCRSLTLFQRQFKTKKINFLILLNHQVNLSYFLNAPYNICTASDVLKAAFLFPDNICIQLTDLLEFVHYAVYNLKQFASDAMLIVSVCKLIAAC